jgi:hypothetical protein
MFGEGAGGLSNLSGELRARYQFADEYFQRCCR